MDPNDWKDGFWHDIAGTIIFWGLVIAGLFIGGILFILIFKLITWLL